MMNNVAKQSLLVHQICSNSYTFQCYSKVNKPLLTVLPSPSERSALTCKSDHEFSLHSQRPLKFSYLCKEGLVDLHTLIRALRQNISASVPAVAHWRVGVGYAAKENRPLVVELLFGFSYTLMNRDDWVIQV